MLVLEIKRRKENEKRKEKKRKREKKKKRKRKIKTQQQNIVSSNFSTHFPIFFTQVPDNGVLTPPMNCYSQTNSSSIKNLNPNQTHSKI